MKKVFKTLLVFPFLAAAAFCTWSFASAASASEPSPQKYFIKFRDPLPLEQVRDKLAGAGLVLKRRVQEIGVEVAAPAQGNLIAEEQLVQLKQNPEIQYIEPVGEIHILSVPNDTFYPEQQPDLARISVEKAWDVSTGSPDVVVAVTDTGISVAHSELRHTIWTNAGEIVNNGIDDDKNGYVDDVHGWNFAGNASSPVPNNYPDDDHGHGTHVAGIIGAEGNNLDGITGINWRVTLMPVKLLNYQGSGSLEAGVQAILYAAQNGARVINASWGSATASLTLHETLDFAWNHGALVIAAAGNDGQSTDKIPNFPSSDSSLGVLAIAASEATGTLAGYSNFGDGTVDIVAPGSNILSTIPGNNYRRMSGTSMATPMVSGIAALMLSVEPRLTALELRNGLLNAAVEASGYLGKISTAGDISAQKAVEQLKGGFQIWPGRLSLPLNTPYPLTAWNAKGAVKWSVANPKIASIDANGVVTLRKKGETRVIATDGSGATVQTAWVRSAGTGAYGACQRARHNSRAGVDHWETAGAALSFSLPVFAAFIGRIGFGRATGRRPENDPS